MDDTVYFFNGQSRHSMGFVRTFPFFLTGCQGGQQQKPVKSDEKWNMILKMFEKHSWWYNMYIHTMYIWSPPPPGAIRALGAGIIILDNYVINMITCSKTLQIPVKNASCMHMTLNILTFQKEKNSNFLKPESGSEKGPINLQIVNPLHEKRTWPFKKLHGKQKVANVSRTFANNRNNITIEMNNCIGF